jgi:hypothetical protein
MTRFQPQWCDHSPSFPGCTGYRIVDTKHRLEAGFVACMQGNDRKALKSRETALQIAIARCAELEKKS